MELRLSFNRFRARVAPRERGNPQSNRIVWFISMLVDSNLLNLLSFSELT